MIATKLVDDNNRLRRTLLEKKDKDDNQWKDEKIVELEFLLGEHKRRNKGDLQQHKDSGRLSFTMTNGCRVNEIE